MHDCGKIEDQYADLEKRFKMSMAAHGQTITFNGQLIHEKKQLELQIREKDEQWKRENCEKIKAEFERDAANRLNGELRSSLAAMLEAFDEGVDSVITDADVKKARDLVAERPNRVGDGHMCVAMEDLPCSVCGRVAEKRKHEHKYIGRQCECGEFKALEPLEGPGSVDE